MRRKRFEETDQEYLDAVLGAGDRVLARMAVVVGMFVALLFLCSLFASAAVKPCNASRVTAGDCTNASTQTILLYAIPTADLLEFADDLAELYGWPTITCTAADVAASPARCSAGQIGQPVTTPETKTAFANRMLGEEIRRRVFQRRKRLNAAAGEATAVNPPAIE